MTGHQGMSRLKEPRLKQTRWPSELYTRLKTYVGDQNDAARTGHAFAHPTSMDEVIRTATDKFLRQEGYWPAEEAE